MTACPQPIPVETSARARPIACVLRLFSMPFSSGDLAVAVSSEHRPGGVARQPGEQAPLPAARDRLARTVPEHDLPGTCPAGDGADRSDVHDDPPVNAQEL